MLQHDMAKKLMSLWIDEQTLILAGLIAGREERSRSQILGRWLAEGSTRDRLKYAREHVDAVMGLPSSAEDATEAGLGEKKSREVPPARGGTPLGPGTAEADAGETLPGSAGKAQGPRGGPWSHGVKVSEPKNSGVPRAAPLLDVVRQAQKDRAAQAFPEFTAAELEDVADLAEFDTALDAQIENPNAQRIEEREDGLTDRQRRLRDVLFRMPLYPPGSTEEEHRELDRAVAEKNSVGRPRGPHMLMATNGERFYCGGPGLCVWCDQAAIYVETPTGEGAQDDRALAAGMATAARAGGLLAERLAIRLHTSFSDAQKILAMPPSECPDCIACKKHAYSDATTAGFFYTECTGHRVAAEVRKEMANMPIPEVPEAAFEILSRIQEMTQKNSGAVPPPLPISDAVDLRLEVGDILYKADLPFKTDLPRIEMEVYGFPGSTTDPNEFPVNPETIDPSKPGMILTQEMSLEEARRRFPLHAIVVDSGSSLVKAPQFTPPDKWPWDGFGEKPQLEAPSGLLGEAVNEKPYRPTPTAPGSVYPVKENADEPVLETSVLPSRQEKASPPGVQQRRKGGNQAHQKSRRGGHELGGAAPLGDAQGGQAPQAIDQKVTELAKKIPGVTSAASLGAPKAPLCTRQGHSGFWRVDGYWCKNCRKVLHPEVEER
jgi:hypothetical protein